MILGAKALPENIGANTRIYSQGSSFVTLRDASLVRQARDYSCGAAALATLLTYTWNDPASEEELLASLARILPAEELSARRDSGLSLFDLQRLAKARGYQAEGFRISPAQLSNLNTPVIVYIEPERYKHFVVLSAVSSDFVRIADPAKGNVTLPMYHFLEVWLGESESGVIFAIEPIDSLPLSLQTVIGMDEAKASSGALDVRSFLPSASHDNAIRSLMR